ncbi:aminomuconate-semialdehyde/2-hydroxymuconate-6-semialdehyde dehydrogenase [Rhodococcus rhodochrous J3]|uniref:Aminomuconate-semialdehyde/2-hydroxymuconate-6-semialdehyde dehydrogenase n=1 Tax=Rhodococcus rhodochrous J3 TaxID=903528 RepID=A0ABY1M9G0_RHORH|nr:2-hydroxymuconic semialdehyde dehydrogenase [Rhodococcus rhodochrous]MBF4481385.1 2-hydroxymuconic semialdehyde dehydrogenase [Rhodococcus rhodochrous]SMG31227.1 aminomuconate-semialdehyde/2-hydroxymuconate-6-semialdehyde dehydrogenase [Rhodococcus rhodochrous J3]
MKPIHDGWIRNFVDGEFVEPDSRRGFDQIDPSTGRIVARVHEADRPLVDRAVTAARRALDRGWADTPVRERTALLRRVADRIEERFDEFVAAEISDTGKPLTQARELDVTRAIVNFRTFADIVAAAGQESFLTDLAGGRQALNYAVRKPLGVVAVIVPWNLPLLLLTWKVAPALACGNAIVVKPSEETPSTATLLAEVLAEAGLPAGAYNVVHGFGADSAGEYLTTHPGIDGVTFTGSSATGAHVMKTVAPRVRPVSFELGGKNAAIVFDDVNIDEAVTGLAKSIFTNTGQVCLCTERVYVQRAIFDDIAAGLAERAESLRLGDPNDPNTTTGPLISQGHRDKILGYLRLAEESGAKVLTGGGIPELGPDLDGGSWIEPTLWTGLTNTDRVLREEIFGPVAALVPFDTEDEAIALANDTEYGLASAVWTNDLRRGHRVAQKMHVGISWVNTWFTRELRSPFGGMGLSGIGREGGESSLHFYSEPTNICVQL